MKKDTYKTKVIFRQFKEGDIIAIFPEQLGTDSPRTCGSYQHVGQHGACDPSIIADTLPAKDYADLQAELESLGYNLEIRRRYRHTFTLNRIEQLNTIVQ